jgi:type II secretory pathway pseudopilin PulG
MRASSSRRFAAAKGFTYLGVLLIVVLMGVGLAGAGVLWSTAAQRDREAELLFVGDQFRRAIGSYHDSSAGEKQFPLRLDDLLRDARLPNTRRHLRRIYVDPMTGKSNWGLVMRGDRIVGVYSRSEAEPIKRAGFAPGDAAFETASAYSEWRFVYAPGGGGAGGPVPAASAMPGVAAATANDVRGSPQAPAARPSAAVPKAAWVCTAERASDLRDCERSADATPLQTCREEANTRYRACVGPGLSARRSDGSE